MSSDVGEANADDSDWIVVGDASHVASVEVGDTTDGASVRSIDETETEFSVDVGVGVCCTDDVLNVVVERANAVVDLDINKAAAAVDVGGRVASSEVEVPVGVTIAPATQRASAPQTWPGGQRPGSKDTKQSVARVGASSMGVPGTHLSGRWHSPAHTANVRVASGAAALRHSLALGATLEHPPFKSQAPTGASATKFPLKAVKEVTAKFRGALRVSTQWKRTS